MKKRLIILLVTVLAAGCYFPMGGKLSSSFNLPPQAWIDAPLDQSHIPLAPYQVTFHGSDPGGVTQGELTVNGEVLTTLATTSPDNTLSVFRTEWSPSAPGEYTLQARALNSDGAWSEYAQAVVEVGEPTPTTTLTPTPTLTPTETVTPTPMQQGGFINQTSPNQVYLGFCSPTQVYFGVTTNPATGVTGMVVFTRLRNAAGSGQTGWDAGTAMNPQGGGTFTRTVNTSAISGAAQYSAAYVDYQFVATGSGGAILARSDVYSNIVLTTCGSIIRIPVIPLPLIGTVTPTIEVVK